MNIGQADVTTAEAVGKLLVIDSEEVEKGCMEVVDLQRVFNGLVAPLVGGAEDCSGFDPGSRHPERETEFVVIPAIATLGEWSPAELSGPQDKGIIQHAAGLEILKQSRDWLIYRARVVSMILLQATVGIPAVFSDVWDGELHESHAPLDKAAGNEALACVSPGPVVSVVDSVEVLGGLALVAEIHELGNRQLHACGQFVIGDGGFQLGIAPGGCRIEASDELALEQLAPGVALVRVHICDRGAVGIQQAATMGRSEKSIGKAIQTSRRDPPPVYHDKPG